MFEVTNRWGYNESNRSLDTYPAPPSADNWLGTDDRGRDILTRLIYGYRVSMFFGLITLIIAIIIAVATGGTQAYFGGWIDMAGQRAVEVWSSLPYLYVLILLVNIYEPGIFMLILSNSAFVWIALSYYVRAEVLKVRKQAYVEAATSLGGGHKRGAIDNRTTMSSLRTSHFSCRGFTDPQGIYKLAGVSAGWPNPQRSSW